MSDKMNIKCDHKRHGCQKNSFIWINYSKKMIYLEIPKNGSTFMKKILSNEWKNLDKKKYIDNNNCYSNYFVFTIFRDMEERIVSNYKDFCLSNKGGRVNQMCNLFKLPKNAIKQLSFSDFLKLASKYNDHHWNSQIKYMYLTLEKKPIIYNIKDLDKLLEKLNIKNEERENQSIKKSFEITNDERKLIENIYKEDYENLELIYNNMFKSD